MNKMPSGIKMIHLSDVFHKAFAVYRKNFLKLTVFSLINFVAISLFPIANFLKGNQLLNVLLTLCSFVFMFAVVPKIQLSIQIYISNLLNGEKIPIKNCFMQTKGKVLRLLGNQMVVALFMCVSLIFVFITQSNVYSRIFMEVWTLMIQALYFMLIPVIVFEDQIGLNLKKASSLIKGNYHNMLIFTFFTFTLLSILNNLAEVIFKDQAVAVFICNMLINVVHIFMFAFSGILQVVVYRQLKEKAPE